MRKDYSTTVGEGRVGKRNGWIQILPDIQIAVVQRRSDDFEKQFVRLRNRRRNVVRCEYDSCPRGIW